MSGLISWITTQYSPAWYPVYSLNFDCLFRYLSLPRLFFECTECVSHTKLVPNRTEWLFSCRDEAFARSFTLSIVTSASNHMHLHFKWQQSFTTDDGHYVIDTYYYYYYYLLLNIQVTHLKFFTFNIILRMQRNGRSVQRSKLSLHYAGRWMWPSNRRCRHSEIAESHWPAIKAPKWQLRSTLPNTLYVRQKISKKTHLLSHYVPSLCIFQVTHSAGRHISWSMSIAIGWTNWTNKQCSWPTTPSPQSPYWSNDKLKGVQSFIACVFECVLC